MKKNLSILIVLYCFVNSSLFAQNTTNPVPFPLNYLEHPLYKQAVSYSDALDWKNAEKYWTEFSLIYPSEVPSFNSLASAKMGLGKYNEAYHLFNQAYLMNPFSSTTISEFAYLCAMFGKMNKGVQLANQLARVVNPSNFEIYKKWYQDQVAYYGSTSKQGQNYQQLIDTYTSTYQQLGSFNTIERALDTVVNFRGGDPRQILNSAYGLKNKFTARGIDASAYHWVLTDLYKHIETYGAKGEWMLRELILKMISEYKNNPNINKYYKLAFGEKQYIQYAGSSDNDRAYALNSKMISETKSIKMFQYKLINLYVERAKLLYNMGRYNEFSPIATSLETLANNYNNPQFKANIYEVICLLNSEKGDLNKGINYGEKALTIIKENKFRGEKALKSLLSICYLNNGNFKKGLAYAGIKDNNNSYLDFYNIGSVFETNKQYEKAITYYKKALQSFDNELPKFSDRQKLTLRSEISLLYNGLARVHHFLGNKEEVYNTLEKSKTRALVTNLGGKNATITPLSELQNSLANDEVFISYRITDKLGFLVVAVTNKSITTQFPSFEVLVQTAKKYFSDGLKKLDVELSNAEFKSPEFIPINTDVERNLIPVNDGDFELFTELYRKYLTNKLQNYTKFPPEAIPKIGNSISNDFYRFFLEELIPFIGNRKKLYISADGVLNFIPFEAMRTSNNKYLAAVYDIKMIPSATVWSLLKKRKYANTRKNIIAFGGAIYDEVQSNVPIVNSLEDVNKWQLASYNLVKEGKPLTDLFKAMGYGKMNYLPGTLNEVNAIAQIFENTTLITGKEMTEAKVKALSKSGELKNYKVVHFATHGWVINSMPEVSGLAMCIPKVSTDGEDGRLIAKEVSNLKLNADMVMLSACQTGLGKLYGGEGVSGLNQAFLEAGANSTIVSLWPVNDYATSILVKEMHRLVKEQKISYSKALLKVKRNFIAGKYNTNGLDLSKPIYWAPFVYNGK